MSRFKLEVGTATDTGRERHRNEDFCATYVPGSGAENGLRGLLLVADGMGGERGGAEASRVAVERVLEELSSETHRFRTDETGHQELTEVVRRVIRETSDQIFRMGTSDPSVRGLGSTLVMVAFQAEDALVAHVGDSRCYRVRRGGIECLTCDHTWIAAEVEAGTISPEEARLHPRKGVLTRTLGDAVSPGVDVRAETLEDRDLFILCSDGLTNALTDTDIFEVSQRFVRPQDLAEALVALAIANDGSDNATAVVCRCRDAARVEAEPEDTEPIYVPEPRRSGVASRASRWWVALAVLLVLVAAFVGPRWAAVRAFDRGKEHAVQGEYLHARSEFARAIRLGLDKARTEELIDILLRFPSHRVEVPSAADAAAAEGDSRDPAGL